MKKIAVVLLNLGGPKTQEDVRPFLFNLFKDPFIIPLPFGLRHAVAALISTTRAPSARENYALMGGGSPIVAETEAQAKALQDQLGEGFRVFVGMRYWHPFIEDVAKQVAAFAPDEVVLMPLYPQFSSTTTLTAFEAFTKAFKGKVPAKTVCCYATNPDFIEAHADLIRQALAKVPDPQSYRLLFSAHGLPEKTVAAGDPYQSHVEATVAAVMQRIGVQDHLICYQSRVGPMKWIGPSTDESLKQAGAEGKKVILIPIAFVSEHIETLVELDIEYGHLAKDSGITDYVRLPALGVNPHYIKALKDEIARALESTSPIIGDQDCAGCHSYCLKRRAA